MHCKLHAFQSVNSNSKCKIKINFFFATQTKTTILQNTFKNEIKNCTVLCVDKLFSYKF